MNKKRSWLLFFAAGFMELSWIYAVAVFLLFMLNSRVFPLLEAAVTFFAAAVITSLYRGRGWRVIQALGLHILGFSGAALRSMYVFFGCTEPFFSSNWVIGLFCGPREPLEGLVFGLLIILSAVFWAGGVFYGLRPDSYQAITSRFDLGIAVFFFTLLISGGIGIVNPAGNLLVPFFLFSMFSIVLVRNRGSGRREYLAGYRVFGLVLVFAVIVIVFTGSILILFLPYLTMTAKASYVAIKKIAGPLGPVLIAILRFIFGRGSIRPDAGDSGLTGDGDIAYIEPVEKSWWTEILEKVLAWGGAGLLLLLGLFVAGWGIRILLRWLLSRTPGEGERRSIREEFMLWLRTWWNRWQALFSFLRGFFSRTPPCQSQVVLFFRLLLAWGKASGIPIALSETPFEYGVRLGGHFPKFKGEIGLIVDHFNREIYGKKTLKGENLIQLKNSWRRLNSPLHWPTRFKMWFFQGRLSAVVESSEKN